MKETSEHRRSSWPARIWMIRCHTYPLYLQSATRRTYRAQDLHFWTCHSRIYIYIYSSIRYIYPSLYHGRLFLFFYHVCWFTLLAWKSIFDKVFIKNCVHNSTRKAISHINFFFKYNLLGNSIFHQWQFAIKISTRSKRWKHKYA